MDKFALLGQRADSQVGEPVEIDGIGVVLVRALTRAEAFRLRGKGLPEDELERRVIALAMVDPVLTEAEVGEWQNVAPSGELDKVMGVISEMSGMVKTADKEAYKSAGE